MAADQWEAWIAAVRDGDDDAAEEFWQRYAAPLIRLADRNLQDRLRRRIDPEDVVQSVFRTALRRIQGGQFELNSDEQLWRLLCAITLNKSRRQARRNQQQNRALDREVYLDPANSPVVSGAEPTPSDAAALVELIERVLSDSADDEQRQVFLMKLDGYTNGEIAGETGRSERTVRRICGQLKSQLTRLLET